MIHAKKRWPMLPKILLFKNEKISLRMRRYEINHFRHGYQYTRCEYCSFTQYNTKCTHRPFTSVIKLIVDLVVWNWFFFHSIFFVCKHFTNFTPSSISTRPLVRRNFAVDDTGLVDVSRDGERTMGMLMEAQRKKRKTEKNRLMIISNHLGSLKIPEEQQIPRPAKNRLKKSARKHCLK